MSPPVRVVATVAAGPDAPALRVRSLIPSEALREAGVAVRPAPLFTRDEAHSFDTGGPFRRARVLRRAHRRSLARMRSEDSPVVVIHRQADLGPSLAVERAAAQGRRLVYDLDDAIWLSGSRLAGGSPLATLKRSSRKAEWLAATAERVIAGNVVLAEWLSQHASDVTVIPSLVDTARIEPRRHTDRRELVLGWIGSRTTAPYLHRIATPIKRLARGLPGREVRLLMVGAPSSVQLDGVLCEHVAWSDEAERVALAQMDIGLMPLPDNAWTRGKCSYKAIQYMAAGVPVVADDVGTAESTIEGGGYVVRDDYQWAEALLALAEDEALRSRLGGAGRRRAVANYSVDRWARPLAALIKGEL
jgi:glycosyltransferase involved in cell wall biosynthesis